MIAYLFGVLLLLLVGIFFASFVLYYFVNWKYLSDLWLFR